MGHFRIGETGESSALPSVALTPKGGCCGCCGLSHKSVRLPLARPHRRSNADVLVGGCFDRDWRLCEPSERSLGTAVRRLNARECARVTPPYILQAIERLEDGIQHSFGAARVYEVVGPSGFRAAPTAVFGLAASEALGIEVRPARFNARQGTPCFRAIKAAGLAIEPIAQSDGALSDEDATWLEGNARRISHIRLERNPRAVQQKEGALQGLARSPRVRALRARSY